MAGIGKSWGKIIERIGLLLLAALALVISWVLTVRLFEWVLGRMGG